MEVVLFLVVETTKDVKSVDMVEGLVAGAAGAGKDQLVGLRVD